MGGDRRRGRGFEEVEEGESFESFEHRGRSAPPLRCLLEEEWGNPERWLGGETPHSTWGEEGSAVPGGEGQLAWQDVMGSEA